MSPKAVFKNRRFQPCNGIACLFLILSCTKSGDDKIPVPSTPQLPEVSASFTLMTPQQTGVYFSNLFKENFMYNIFTYEYLYNGGGVAAGDVNGDGLPDLYFSSAFAPNKLYINQGNLTFSDMTEAAGVAALEGYKTGVAMADVNGDGKLDIYSCRTSKDDDGKKTNHLFINMGNQVIGGVQVPVFEDQAKKLGLDDNSNSNHGCFFDFDKDGDLDLFLLNHRIGFSDAEKIRVLQEPDGSMSRITTPQTPFESNRFYRNDNGRFMDMTEKAGLVNSAFGLSATAADINQDGWIDIYVANDYIEPDHIYINNKNGTFTDKYNNYLKHSSQNSMGSDVADFNNDGLVDIIALDMKAEDPIRYKQLKHIMQYDRYQLLVQYGYGRQDARNVLQLNNGNNTFSEIGQFAGISMTDWSWTPLIADFDNDGWKDIYITNGYRKDVTDQEYLNFFRDSILRTGGLNPQRFPDIYEVLKHIPERRIANYLYINSTQLSFINAGKQAGMDHPSFSNGAAYADLDMDGDLDIIVNNIEDPAFIYRNDIGKRSWLQIDVRQGNNNIIGLGTTVEVFAGDNQQFQMVLSNKGFLSSSEPILHFGLGNTQVVDSMILRRLDGSAEIMKNVAVNQRLIWKNGTGASYKPGQKTQEPVLFSKSPDVLPWQHKENEFVDFKRERLVPYMISKEGPCLSIGDVNGDKLEDIYAGNGAGYASAVLLQSANGGFNNTASPVFTTDAIYEDCGSVLEDFDGDGDLDLLVISGGNSFNPNETEYMTRYYINDGKGNFSRVNNFPIIRTNAGAVLAIDADQDGDKDILIGGRSTPGSFPKSPKSFFLKNDKGTFTDATQDVFPELENLGMITDIQSADLDGDSKAEVLFAGEWMPLSIFSFDGKKFINQTKSYGLENTSGWWKSIKLADIDGDGKMDLIAGNIGLNHRLHTSSQFPVTLIANDFDGNGSVDPIMCYFYNNKLYPYAGRDEIVAQMPSLKKKYLRYTPYASATIDDIFSKDQLKASTYLYAKTFETTYFRNEGKKLVAAALPYQVQLSPVYGILVKDFNGDGRDDLLLAGNFNYAETETGELDAGNGTLLLQQQNGSFEFVPNRKHGFWAQKEVRELHIIKLASGNEAILTGNNQGVIDVHLVSKSAHYLQ